MRQNIMPLAAISKKQTWRSAMSGIANIIINLIAHSTVSMCALLVFVVFCLSAASAELLAPYDPMQTDYSVIRQSPSWAHPLGTDDLGRDVLSRLLYGARISLFVAVTAVALGDLVGLIWGVVSGYRGGKVDLFSQRLLDILLSFPSLLIALMLMVSLGPGLKTVILAIAVERIPMSTRIVRGVTLAVKQFTYVEAARAIGASGSRIMIYHVIPQCLAPYLVVVSAHIGVAVFMEAALSFLGVGVPPPMPSWGNMLGGVLSQAFSPPWWLVVFPGLAITMTILCANILGDALRDVLDPTLRGRLRIAR